MKRIVLFFAALACTIGLSFAKDNAEGYWLSIDEKSGKVTASWNIYEENGLLYGKIIRASEQPESAVASECKESYKGFPVSGKVNQMPLCGTPFIFGLTKLADGKWGKGNIIDPNDGSMYTCTITFHEKDGAKYREDTLEMRGSIGPLGRSQFWKKTTEAQALEVK